MTPEELNAQLQSLLNFMTESFHRSDERFERIDARLEIIATRIDQNTVQINELGVRIDQLGVRVEETWRQIQQTNATVASVARLLERHIRDGHGAKPKRKKQK